jgi:uncharacterized protein (DUF1330 family)
MFEYRRRFFVLRGKALHYYHDDEDKKQAKRAMVVTSIGPWAGKENGLIFNGPSSTLYAIADSWADAAKWLSAMQKPKSHVAAVSGAQESIFSILITHAHDKPRMRDYSIGCVHSILASDKYGANILASDVTRGSAASNGFNEAMMISGWPSSDSFDKWYSSSEYEAWKTLRMGAAHSHYYLLSSARAWDAAQMGSFSREGVFVMCETRLSASECAEGWVCSMAASTNAAGGVVVASGRARMVEGAAKKEEGKVEEATAEQEEEELTMVVLQHWRKHDTFEAWQQRLTASKPRCFTVGAIGSNRSSSSGAGGSGWGSHLLDMGHLLDIGGAAMGAIGHSSWWSNQQLGEQRLIAPQYRPALPSVWTPHQRSASLCQLCTCPFTLTRRRHRCHCCTEVVCSTCSRHRSSKYLKADGEPGRVCDKCHYSRGPFGGTSSSTSEAALGAGASADTTRLSGIREEERLEGLVKMSPFEAMKLDKQYSMYFKMAAVKVPIKGVCTKMRADGMDESAIAVFGEGNGASRAVWDVNYSEEEVGRSAGAAGASTGAPSQEIVRGSDDGATLGQSKSIGRYVPGVQLKRFHWEPLVSGDGPDEKATVWSSNENTLRQLVPVTIEAADALELARLFGTKTETSGEKAGAAAVRGRDNAKNGGAGRKSSQKPSLLDSRRAMNIHIGLSQFKEFNSPNDIASALLRADSKMLPLAKLYALVEMLPTEAEKKALTRYQEQQERLQRKKQRGEQRGEQRGIPDSLTNAERFMLAMAAVARPQRKVQALILRSQFDERVSILRNQALLLIASCHRILHSAELARAFEVILALTRYMNCDHTGRATRGISLKSVINLARTKSTTDGKTSLLDYMVRMCIARGEKVLEIGDAVQLSVESLSLSNTLMSAEYAAMGREITHVEREYALQRMESMDTMEGGVGGGTRMESMDTMGLTKEEVLEETVEAKEEETEEVKQQRCGVVRWLVGEVECGV